MLTTAYGPLVVAGIFVVDPDTFTATHDLHAAPLRQWWSDRPERARPVHPDPGGLLFCASTEGRDTLWWDTAHPDADRWTIVWDIEFDRHPFPGSLTELLAAELSGRLDPRLTAFATGD